MQTERPSVRDFSAFRMLRMMVDAKDIMAEAVRYWDRSERRALERRIGPLRIRTDEEIIAELSALGENCNSQDLSRVYFGVPKEKWAKTSQWLRSGTQWSQGHQPTLGDRLSVRGVDNKADDVMAHLARWFAGKRYGIVVDDQVAQALMESEVDVTSLEVKLPWSPMIVKGPSAEFLMWDSGGRPRYEMFHWDEEKNEPGMTLSGGFVGNDKESLAAWLSTVTKGEEAGDTFELKVGETLVAVLPMINAQTLIMKHKITAESGPDKGSWVRKGHFRMTKAGLTWVEGSHFKKELPFVLKQHSLERKGQSQELFKKS